MLSWENVAPNKRLILSKRICPVTPSARSRRSSTTTTRPCSTDHQHYPRYISTIKKIPPDKSGKPLRVMRPKSPRPDHIKTSKSTSFDSVLSNSIPSMTVSRCPASRTYSDSCSEYSNNLNSSSRSTDMRTPEDLAEFSLETRTSSGKSFTSLNAIHDNPKVICEKSEVKKAEYIESQPLSSLALLKSETKLLTPRVTYHPPYDRTAQAKLATADKYRLSADIAAKHKHKVFPKKSFVNAGKFA